MWMMRTFQPLGQEMEVAIVAAQRVQRLHGRKNIVAVDTGAPMSFAHQVKLPFDVEPSGVLRVPSIDAVDERPYAPLGRTQNHDCSIGFDVHVRNLLARAQVRDGIETSTGGNSERNAATGPAPVKAKHEAGLFRRSPVDKRIDTEGAMKSDQSCRRTLYEFEAGLPHQRAITENPKVIGAVFGCGIHYATAHNRAWTQPQGTLW